MVNVQMEIQDAAKWEKQERSPCCAEKFCLCFDINSTDLNKSTDFLQNQLTVQYIYLFRSERSESFPIFWRDEVMCPHHFQQ